MYRGDGLEGSPTTPTGGGGKHDFTSPPIVRIGELCKLAGEYDSLAIEIVTNNGERFGAKESYLLYTVFQATETSPECHEFMLIVSDKIRTRIVEAADLKREHGSRAGGQKPPMPELRHRDADLGKYLTSLLRLGKSKTVAVQDGGRPLMEAIRATVTGSQSLYLYDCGPNLGTASMRIVDGVLRINVGALERWLQRKRRLNARRQT